MINANSMKRDDDQYAVAMKAAILGNKDYRHFPLCLNNHSRRNVAGIDVIRAKSAYSEQQRGTIWGFEVVGGAADFQPDLRYGGRKTYDMLRTEHNMKFLASCYKQGFWDIMDKDIENEVKEIYNDHYKNLFDPYHSQSKTIDQSLMEEIKISQQQLNTCSSEKVPAIRAKLADLYKRSQNNVAPEDPNGAKDAIAEVEETKKTKTVRQWSPKEMLKKHKSMLKRKNLTDAKREEIEGKVKQLEIDLAPPEPEPQEEPKVIEESELVTIEQQQKFMNTNEFLNILEAHTDADGMAREGANSLLFYTNEAQNMLLNTPTEQNIMFGSDGRLPVLNTTVGVYEYQAPANYWRIAGILVESGTTGSLLDRNWYSDYYPSYTYNLLHRANRRVDIIDISGVHYGRIQYVRTYDAGDNVNASVLFTEDPGNTTDIYRWWAYKKPTKLFSDSIQLSVKSPYDYLYLFPLTIALIQSFKSGNIEEGITKAQIIKKQYEKELNKGAQGQEYDAIDRGF